MGRIRCIIDQVTSSSVYIYFRNCLLTVELNFISNHCKGLLQTYICALSLSLSPFLFDFRSTHFNKRTEQEKIEKVKLSLSIQTKGEVCVTEMNYTVDIHRLVQVQVNQNRIFLSVKSLSSHLFRMVTFRASKN